MQDSINVELENDTFRKYFENVSKRFVLTCAQRMDFDLSPAQYR